MLSTRLVRNDVPVHFGVGLISDDDLDAMARPLSGDPVLGVDSTLPAPRRDDALVWRDEAVSALHDGDAALALRCWCVVRQLQPGVPDVLFHIGCCHALLGEPAQAFLNFSTLARRPDASASLRRRAARLAALVDPIAD